MVTPSGGLRTYHQRNWGEDFLYKHYIDNRDIVNYVGVRAIPFIGLFYKPAGRAISLFQSYVNATGFMGILAMNGKEMSGMKMETGHFAWPVIKSVAEMVGTLASLRIGLAVHTIMNLGENLFALREFNKISGSEISDKIGSVVSNALYLLTLVNFSTPVSYGVIGASLVFQIAWNLNKALSEFTSLMEPPKLEVEVDSYALRAKKIDVAAHFSMGVIYLLELMKILQASAIESYGANVTVDISPDGHHMRDADGEDLWDKGLSGDNWRAWATPGAGGI